PGCTAATTGPAGLTTTSSAGVPGIDAPEPVTISNVYVAGTRPTGKRNTAVPLPSVTARASCGGPPGIPELPRTPSGTPACGASPRLTCTRATASLPTVTASRAGIGAA